MFAEDDEVNSHPAMAILEDWFGVRPEFCESNTGGMMALFPGYIDIELGYINPNGSKLTEMKVIKGGFGNTAAQALMNLVEQLAYNSCERITLVPSNGQEDAWRGLEKQHYISLPEGLLRQCQGLSSQPIESFTFDGDDEENCSDPQSPEWPSPDSMG